MKRNESIDALSKRWYAGKTSDVEEQQLREAFLNPNDNTDSGVCDSRQLEALLFAGFRELAAEQMSESRQTVVGPSETTVPPADKRPALRIVRRPLHRIIWRAATVAAILVFGVVLGLQLREPYCYIDGKAIYDRETALAATEYLDGLTALRIPEQVLDQLLKN
ncbi:MAG: hypothetical protein K1V70_05845 [Alistipes sp.]|jgi:hypothetical protein